MGEFLKVIGSFTLLLLIGIQQCIGNPKKYTGHDHGHGHGWMKLHNNRHHDASSKLSEAYVKFHKLGDNQSKGGNRGGGGGGIFGNIFGNKFGGGGGGGGHAGGGDESQDQGGWSMPQPAISSGGWGQPMMMMMGGGGWGMESSGSSMGGWGGGGGGARPTGWASAGGSSVGQRQKQQQPTGWQTGDFGRFRPGNSGNRDKGHLSFELPSGKPAYIQKLKPLIDLPKLSLKGWGW